VIFACSLISALGKTDFVQTAMWKSSVSIRTKMLALLNGEEVTVPFERDISYESHHPSTPEIVWSLLYSGGYLTGKKIGDWEMKAKVPNTV
jgi:hypothetical protein